MDCDISIVAVLTIDYNFDLPLVLLRFIQVLYGCNPSSQYFLMEDEYA